MPRDARFWRNVTIVAAAHIAIAVTLVGWSRQAGKLDQPSIVWMSAVSTDAASKKPPARAESPVEATPRPEIQPSSKQTEQDAAPVPSPAKSDIQLPVATPSPTAAATPIPKPSMTPFPKVPPKRMPSPTPKSVPKKNVVARPTPAPPPKSKVKPAEQPKANNENSTEKETVKPTPAGAGAPDGEKAGAAGSSAGARASEFSWYGKMLYQRFYSEWIQPTTSVAAGAKMSALVRIRIEKDGRISKFTIVHPSGNVAVDESVAAVAKRVTQVDPLPRGLGDGAHYEVNINFALNPIE